MPLFAYAQPQKAKWVYGIAILPTIFAYQSLIIEDIPFLNAFLFCDARIHFYSVRDLRPRLLSPLVWSAITFYDTCATYQAAIASSWLCLLFTKFYLADRSKNG